MGSPYFVHKHTNAVHVVRTIRGFERILEVVATSMGIRNADSVSEYSAEWITLRDLRDMFASAWETRSRQVVFLEARYEWHGWEKFQRVIVFDFTQKDTSQDTRHR